MAAGELSAGSRLTSRSGSGLSVGSVSWQRQSPAAKAAMLSSGRQAGYAVYNFEVEKTHSYFVGNQGGGTWVHNEDCTWVLRKGKQDLHTPGTANHTEAIARGETTRSEFTHPDPQGLLDKFANPNATTGTKETVNFGEIIGNDVNHTTGIKTPTTLGKIHYGKGVAHIVPVLTSGL